MEKQPRLTREQIHSLKVADRVYRIGRRLNILMGWIFCGAHPYGKGKRGVIFHSSANVSDFIAVFTHHGAGQENTSFDNYEYYTDYETAKARFIEINEEELATIKEIYA